MKRLKWIFSFVCLFVLMFSVSGLTQSWNTGWSPCYNADYKYPDYSAVDQGILGSSNTVKYYVDTLGSNSGTILFRHNSGEATTTYQLSTDETIPFNINTIIEKGAILNTDLSIRSAAYKWTASDNGVSEYYLELAAGGDTGISTPSHCAENNSALTEATAGALAVSQWDWADNDTLGYSTVYVRLSDSTDPDVKAVDYVEAGYTFTINGPFNAGPYQVFSGDGSVSFPEGAYGGYAGWANKRRVIVNPHWWGVTHDGDATITTTALQKAINSGGDIYCPIPGEIYNTNSTLNLADINYDFNYCNIYYDGSGTAVSIAKLYGNEIKRMYISKKELFTDGDGSIGFLARYMYRTRVDVHTQSFETGIALKPNVGEQSFTFCEFRSDGQNHKYTLDVDVTGYYMTTCKFYDFETGGSWAYAGSIGARFVGPVLDTVFYNPIVENVKTGFYLEGTEYGFTVYNCYGEVVDKHFDLGADVVELILHGGYWRGGGASLGNHRPVEPENVADSDTKIYQMNTPMYAYGNDVVFWGEGVYRGKSQKFTNIIEGGDFETWECREFGAGNQFTSGGVYELQAGDILTGVTSKATAQVVRVTIYGGSWAGGNATGRLILDHQTGTFQAENCDVGVNADVLTLPGDSTAYLGKPKGFWSSELAFTDAVRSGTQKHSGSYSYRLLNDTGAGQSLYYSLDISDSLINKYRGQSFTVSAWVYCAAAEQIRLQGETIAPSGNTSGIGAFNLVSGEWQLVHTSVVVPADATAIYIFFYMTDIGGATDYLYIDDLMLTIGDNVPGFNGRYYNDSDNILDYQDRLAAGANVATTVTKVNELLDDLKAKGLMKYK